MSPAPELVVPRILVVEDDKMHREWLAFALGEMGYEVACAESGEEALALLLAAPPYHYAAVLTDQFMPRMRGTELLARASSRAAFVVFSGRADPTIERAAEQFGALAFFRKPLPLDRVHAVLWEAAKRRSGEHPIPTPPKKS